MSILKEKIGSPTLLLDSAVCRANIDKMARKARDNEVTFKPHFKTHQSAEIGKWFRDKGVDSITVSSITMAEYFAEAGWEDLTIAFPCNTRELQRINRLASKVHLSILLSDTRAAKTVEQKVDYPLTVYIEIDTGSERTGFSSDELTSIGELVRFLRESSLLRFKGFYSHPGHSYSARSRKEVLDIHTSTRRQMERLKQQFSDGEDIPAVCIGDTPCCSIAGNFESIDEISPGNFVFYDLMQVQIGSCRIEDVALCLAAPVVGVYPDRNELVIHGGAVHLSKDFFTVDDTKLYGRAVLLNSNGWGTSKPGCYVKSLSQEHGIISADPSFIEQVSLGDLIGILPVHSCLTADLMGGYATLDGTFPDHLRGRLTPSNI